MRPSRLTRTLGGGDGRRLGVSCGWRRIRDAPNAGGRGWRPVLLSRDAASGGGGWSSRSPDVPAARGAVEDIALPEEDG
jgi:hypothetical protein